MSKIDTSIDGFEYVGIHLTKEQFSDLQTLNILMQEKDRRDIPVFNMMVLLKTLGLLPENMGSNNSSDNSTDNTNNSNDNLLERKFGRILE